MKSVITIGEVIVDFTPDRKGVGLKSVESFKKNCGGAPANVAAAVSRLGGNSKIITQIGNDAFGDYIYDTLNEAGVSTDCIERTSEAKTGLAFVSLDNSANREFLFYRDPSSDMLMRKEQLNKAWFANIGALHFCSVNLTTSGLRDLHRKAIYFTKQNGGIVSFDPNLRFSIWKDKEEYKKIIDEFIMYSDIVKISDEELEFITGEKSVSTGIEAILNKKVKMVLYTVSKRGAELFTKKATATANNLPVTVADTTGAGDSIIGALLYSFMKDGLTTENLSELSERRLKNAVTFSNSYSNFSVSKSGAISSYATAEEFSEFINNYNITMEE